MKIPKWITDRCLRIALTSREGDALGEILRSIEYSDPNDPVESLLNKFASAFPRLFNWYMEALLIGGCMMCYAQLSEDSPSDFCSDECKNEFNRRRTRYGLPSLDPPAGPPNLIVNEDGTIKEKS